ncbi:hypothetical protein [Pelagibius sp.]|uniref:hypothetical protein n=1 Tax=Pelagibius sp. TaxID=1931238 RepID=UPI003B50FC2D
MPRIPSVSDVRSVSAGVTRDPGVRATAEDFGLAAARGLAGLGLGLGDLAAGLAELERNPPEDETKGSDDPKPKEKQGNKTGGKGRDRGGDAREPGHRNTAFAGAAPRTFAGVPAVIGRTQAAEGVVAAIGHKVAMRGQGKELNRTQDYDGSSPVDVARQAQETIRAEGEQRLKVLAPGQRAAARAAAEPVERAHVLHSLQLAQNQKVAALEQAKAETLAGLKAQAVDDPAAAEMLLAEGLDLLQGLHEAGALTATQLDREGTAFQRELYTDMLRGQPAAAVVTDLEAGLYDAALDDPALKDQLLTETRWRLQSETAQGQAHARAQVAAAEQGRRPPKELSETMNALLAAGNLADVELAVETRQRVNRAVEGLRFAPEADFESAIDALSPAAEAPDRAARLEIQEGVRRGGEALLAARRADPAAYVMDQPAVAAAFAAVRTNPAFLPYALDARLAAQAALGLTAEEQRLLSREEAASMRQGLQSLPADQQAAALSALSETQGTRSGRLAAELEEAGLAAPLAAQLDAGDSITPVRPISEAPEPPRAGFESDIIAETAQLLLAEGEAAPLPPRPLLKPRRTNSVPTSAQSSDDASAALSTSQEESRSDVRPSEQRLLNRYRPLRKENYDALVDGLDPAEVASFEEHINREAERAGASSEIEDLARRLAAQNLRNGYPFADALALALREVGIEDRNLRTGNERPFMRLDARDQVVSSNPDAAPSEHAVTEPSFVALGATRKLDEDLITLGITPALRGDIARAEDAIVVRGLIRRIMNVRQAIAAGDLQEKESLKKEIGALEGTNQKFLVGQLQAKVNRALDRPETVPWALTDAEVYSVYRSLGGSVEVADFVADVAEVAALVNPYALLVAAIGELSEAQQDSLRSAYEAELYRRGIFTRPKS